MKRLTAERVNGIKTGYWSPAKKDELVQRLAEYENTSTDPEAIRIALEKQRPKEPEYEGDGYADGQLVYDTWICPNCGERYEVDYDDYAYCPNCGQAIDRKAGENDEED